MWRRPFLLVCLGAAGAVVAGLGWMVAALTTAGGRIDAAIAAAFIHAGAPPLAPRVEWITRLADPEPFLMLGVAIAGFALVRGRPALAALVALILVAANVTTQTLKAVLPGFIDRLGVAGYEMAWPSGHATAAMSLALCAVLAAGPRLRPAAAMLGAGYAVAMGYAVVAAGSHLPSDVLGGYLVAGSYAALGAAALTASEARNRPRSRAQATRPTAASLLAPAAGALAVVLVAGAAVLAAGSAPLTLAPHAAGLVAGGSIAVLGATVVGAMGFALRR